MSQNPEDNPIGALHELCASANVECTFNYAEDGNEHSKKFKCVIGIMKKEIVGDDFYQKKKDAQKAASQKLLSKFPVLRIDDKIQPNKRGSDHTVTFQYELYIEEVDKKFESAWCKKKDEAKRDLLQTLIRYFLDSDYGTTTPAANQITPPVNDIDIQVMEMLRNWQATNLPKIKRAVGIDEDVYIENLDNYLTVAFIHPSFAYNDQIKKALRYYLKQQVTNYERFEFLGDALLGLIVTRSVFESFPDDMPGALTNKKRQMVREEACSAYLKKMGLEKCIIHRDIFLSHNGKIVGDVFEALIGVLYVIYEEEAFEMVKRIVLNNN